MGEFTAPMTEADRARLGEMFSHLVANEDGVVPISDEERASRRERAAGLCGRYGFDALVIEPGATLEYLTGVRWGHSERLFAFVLTADGDPFWVTPGFEVDRAAAVTRAIGGELVPWQEHDYPYTPLAAALAARDLERVAVEPWIRHRFVRGLEEALGRRVELADDLLVDLRGRKDEHELALLREANERTQRAICAVAETLEPGVTSTEIGRRLTAAQQRLGLTDIWHLALIGPAGAFPHGEGIERTLEAGDHLLVDTGGKLCGYCSDNTRSWVVGGPVTERVRGLWQAVRDAQVAAYEAIVPGQPCGDVDRAARRALAAAGWSEGYEHCFHRLGHGIGTQGHEDPYFDSGSAVPMAPGMCFSNEPGIYLPGELGLRIEDIVCVTEDGADHFGQWQAGPEAPHPA